MRPNRRSGDTRAVSTAILARHCRAGNPARSRLSGGWTGSKAGPRPGLAAVHVVALFAIALPLLGADKPTYELPAEQRTGTIRQVWVVSHSHLDIGFTRPP